MEKQKDNKPGVTEGDSGMAVKAVRVLVVSEDVIVRSSTKTESKYIFDLDLSVDRMISRYVAAGWRVAFVSKTDAVAKGESSPETVGDRSRSLSDVLGFGDVFVVRMFGDPKYRYPYNLRSVTQTGLLVLVEYELGRRGMIVDWDCSLYVSNSTSDRDCARAAEVPFLRKDQFLKYGETIAAFRDMVSFRRFMQTFYDKVVDSDPVLSKIAHSDLHESPLMAPEKEAADPGQGTDVSVSAQTVAPGPRGHLGTELARLSDKIALPGARVRVLCLIDEGVPAEIVKRFRDQGWNIFGPPLHIGTGATLKEFVEGRCNPIWEKSLVVGDDNVSLGMALYCGAQFMTVDSLGDAEAFVGYAYESPAIATGNAVSPGEEEGESSPEPDSAQTANNPAPAVEKPKNKVRVLWLFDKIADGTVEMFRDNVWVVFEHGYLHPSEDPYELKNHVERTLDIFEVDWSASIIAAESAKGALDCCFLTGAQFVLTSSAPDWEKLAKMPWNPLPVQPAWRKVSEELPAYDKEVLVYCPVYAGRDRIRKGCLSRSSTDSTGVKHYFYIQDVTIEQCTVTYWMPIPEPPKE